jgi:hypothetical protein
VEHGFPATFNSRKILFPCKKGPRSVSQQPSLTGKKSNSVICKMAAYWTLIKMV